MSNFSSKKFNHIDLLRKQSRSYRVLQEISAGDMFVGFLLSARSTKLMYQVARRRAQERYQNKKTILELKASGYVTEREVSGQPSFFITKAGKQALREVYRKAHAQHTKPASWDGLWRVVSYDFPEGERSVRNSLRYVLEKAQFLQIQKSVWLSPFDSQELEKVIASHTVAKNHVVVMVVRSISEEERLKVQAL